MGWDVIMGWDGLDHGGGWSDGSALWSDRQRVFSGIGGEQEGEAHEETLSGGQASATGASKSYTGCRIASLWEA